MDSFEKRLAGLRGFLPLEERNVDAFLSEVANITASGDRRAVGPVLLLADDNCPLAGVMTRMLSLLEDVPPAAYVEELMAVLPKFSVASPQSAEDEVKKLLWSEKDRSLLVSNALWASDEQRAALRRLLSSVEAEGLEVLAAEVLGALQQRDQQSDSG
jgi:hypothetical protein